MKRKLSSSALLLRIHLKKHIQLVKQTENYCFVVILSNVFEQTERKFIEFAKIR